MLKKIAVAVVAIPLAGTLAVAGMVLWFCKSDQENRLEWSDHYGAPTRARQ